MRSRSLIVDYHGPSSASPAQKPETDERVRRTLEDALAELEREIELVEIPDRSIHSQWTIDRFRY